MQESVQRSFRLTAVTSQLLDRRTEETGESRNSLVERLLAEALRTERHPLIGFRTGAAGHREPMIIGTRLLVRQVIPLVRADGVDETAASLNVEARIIRAATDYYGDFAHEIDADAARAAKAEADEFARWQRGQAAIA